MPSRPQLGHHLAQVAFDLPIGEKPREQLALNLLGQLGPIATHRLHPREDDRRPLPAVASKFDNSLAGDAVSLLRRTLGDGTGWKAIAYSLIMLPWGIIAFTLCVVVWTVALSLIPSVVLAIVFPANYLVNEGQPMDAVPRIAIAAAAALAGVGLLIVTPAIMHGLSMVDRALVSGLLGNNRVAELEQRVEVLTESRDASLSGAATELARVVRAS